MDTQHHADEPAHDSCASSRPSRLTTGVIAAGAVLLAAAAVVDALRPALFVVHVIGVAVLGIGLAMQARRSEKSVSRMMRDGSCTALVAGPLLVASIVADGGSVNPTKIATKVLIGLAVLVLVLANVRRAGISSGLWALLLLLWLLNVCLAVAW